MKKNYYTVITGSRVILTSYKAIHVPKYHSWMKSEELRKLTASKLLSLTEEYEMQTSWFNDENKCTFIILDKDIYLETKDEVEAMIGDTNLFFNDPDNPHHAEAEIMVADEKFRGQGKGFEAMLLMLHYGIFDCNVDQFSVKIGEDNEKSINLFKKIGFKFQQRSEAFKEITLSKVVTPVFKNWIESNVNFIKIKNCDIMVVFAMAAHKRSIQQAIKEKEKKEKEQKEKELKENEANVKKEEKDETKEEEKEGE